MSVKIDSNYIYICGYANSNTTYSWVLEKRLKSTGEHASGFGSPKIFNVSDAGPSRALTLEADANSVYVAGNVYDPDYYADWWAEKFNITNGVNSSPWVSYNPALSGSDMIMDSFIDGQSIYLLGSHYPGKDPYCRIEKRSVATGALDPFFGTGGFVNISELVYQPFSLTVDAGGIYTGGSNFPAAQGRAWLVHKYSKNGIRDTGFNLTMDSANNDYITDMKSDNTFLYIIGRQQYTPPSAAAINYWHIEKRLASTGGL
jgi:hypothetical protein